jgi:hypothetical protein
MKTEFANSDDVKAYIDKRNLVKVVFDDDYYHYRIAKLYFDDNTYVTLNLEDCHKLKIWKWFWYDGCMIVKVVNFSSINYELKLFDIPLRNFLIDGIALEEQRLKDAWSEEFTNMVRDTDNKKYVHKTILNGVEFVKNKDIY